MNIERKLSLLHRLTVKLDTHLDTHIWEVFNKYIKLIGFSFNGPEKWHVQYYNILFTGWDSCGAESLEIPLIWFIDYDKALAEYNEDIRIKEEQHKEHLQKQKELFDMLKEASDKSEYERLKKKFG